MEAKNEDRGQIWAIPYLLNENFINNEDMSKITDYKSATCIVSS